MKGYLFIGNSTKPTRQENESMEPIKLTNIDFLPLQCAFERGYKLYEGVNRTHAELLECANELPVQFYDQHTYRSIFAFNDNWKAYKNLCRFLENHPNIEILHCNSPIGGVIGRICGHKYGIKKIIYTAHGFHFYKGAPLINRTIFKWIEMLLAHWTDAILTMNQEDFESASKFHMHENGKVYQVSGVGVDTDSFHGINVDRNAIRDSIGVPRDAIMAIAMGDIVPRKNYKTAINAIALAKRPQLHYVICGTGTQVGELKKLAKSLNIGNQIHFLGFRTDIKQLALSSDLYLFSSLQEGLPRSTMEAMCAGLPCVLSSIRGHIDLIEQEKGGLLCKINKVEEFANSLQRMVDNSDFRKMQGKIAQSRIQKFDKSVVIRQLRKIFDDILIN